MVRNLGAVERPVDNRDVLLGAVQAPVSVPTSFLPDISWLTVNWQGDLPACGAHAATHLQAILERGATDHQHYTPRYSWIKIKQIDGFPLDAGTDMRSIFKALQNWGVDDFEPLDNDVTLPLATYSSPTAIMPYMDSNAASKKIMSYGFGNTDFGSLSQHIYQNKAVLLLIKCDDSYWGTDTPVFTTGTHGHFVVAYGYDQNYIYIVCSSDKDFPFKKIARKYITPAFIREAGTAIDIPPAQIQAIIQQTSNVTQAIVQAPNIPLVQKVDWLTQLLNALSSLFAKVGSSSQPTMFSNESKIWNWLVVSSADPTKVATTVKGATGVFISLLALTIHGVDLSTIPDQVYSAVVALAAIGSSIATFVGIVRKIYLTFKPVPPSTPSA